MSQATVAVVDNDAKFLKYVAKLLKSSGYQVLTYTGGGALLEAQQSAASASLILLEASDA